MNTLKRKKTKNSKAIYLTCIVLSLMPIVLTPEAQAGNVFSECYELDDDPPIGGAIGLKQAIIGREAQKKSRKKERAQLVEIVGRNILTTTLPNMSEKDKDCLLNTTKKAYKDLRRQKDKYNKNNKKDKHYKQYKR